MFGPSNKITLPPKLKRYPITIVGNGTTAGTTLLSLAIAGGYVAATDGEVVNFTIEGTQAGVTTARADFIIANTATAADYTNHGKYVAAGAAYTSGTCGEIATAGVVSATAGAVPAVLTLYLTPV